MMKVLVTGARGQVGHDVVSVLRQAGIEPVTPARQELDFLRPETITRTIALHRPDWVINCAAYTRVDAAENEQQAAFRINRDAVRQLAAEVAQAGGRLLHLSTDFVFDGHASRPYTELDATAPLNVYGRSKLDGEQAMCAILPQAIVLRTAWVYGLYGHNFVKTILRAASAGKPLRVVSDQVGAPTWSMDVANVVLQLIRSTVSGTFHYTSAGSTSWHGFAQAILEQAAISGFELKTTTVEPVPTSAWPTPAVRPAYSVLDTGKLAACLSLTIPQWRDSLGKMLMELRSCADCW